MQKTQKLRWTSTLAKKQLEPLETCLEPLKPPLEPHLEPSKYKPLCLNIEGFLALLKLYVEPTRTFFWTYWNLWSTFEPSMKPLFGTFVWNLCMKTIFSGSLEPSSLYFFVWNPFLELLFGTWNLPELGASSQAGPKLPRLPPQSLSLLRACRGNVHPLALMLQVKGVFSFFSIASFSCGDDLISMQSYVSWIFKSCCPVVWNPLQVIISVPFIFFPGRVNFDPREFLEFNVISGFYLCFAWGMQVRLSCRFCN